MLAGLWGNVWKKERSGGIKLEAHMNMLTLTDLSLCVLFSLLNCLSICQSFSVPTRTTMKIATIMATPSTHSTRGSPGGCGVPKVWNRPRAKETTAAIVRRISTLSLYVVQASSRSDLLFLSGRRLSLKTFCLSVKPWVDDLWAAFVWSAQLLILPLDLLLGHLLLGILNSNEVVSGITPGHVG